MCSRGPEGSEKSPNTQDTGTLLVCRRSRSTTEKSLPNPKCPFGRTNKCRSVKVVLRRLRFASAWEEESATFTLSASSSAEDLLKDSPGSPVLPQSARTVLAAIVALELRAGPVRLRENRSPVAFRRRASPHPPAAPVLLCNP